MSVAFELRLNFLFLENGSHLTDYKQLTQKHTYGISLLLKTEMSYPDISHTIGANKSNVSREVRRNRGQRGYPCHQTHRLKLHSRQGKVGHHIIPALVSQRGTMVVLTERASCLTVMQCMQQRTGKVVSQACEN